VVNLLILFHFVILKQENLLMALMLTIIYNPYEVIMV